jgi:hypothetical protein
MKRNLVKHERKGVAKSVRAELPHADKENFLALFSAFLLCRK